MISWKFCIFFDQNPPVGCIKLTFGITWRKSVLILPGFLVVCHLCWLKNGILNIWISILCYYNWIINKITLLLCQSLLFVFKTHSLGASNFCMGQVVGKNVSFCPVFQWYANLDDSIVVEYTWLGFVAWIKFRHWFWGLYWFLRSNTVWIKIYVCSAKIYVRTLWK
jgi:hypothetical protein